MSAPWEFVLSGDRVVPIRVSSGPHPQAPRTWPRVYSAEALGLRSGPGQLSAEAAVLKLAWELFSARGEMVRAIRGGES